MFSKIKTFFKIFLITKNWFNISLVWFLPRKEILAVFRNGYKMKVSKKNWSDFTNCVAFFKAFSFGKIDEMAAKIIYNSSDLVFDFSKKDFGILGNIIEVFSQEVYGPFLENYNFKNRDVVDIGALIGDTAIYFALKGAKKVYAFEPLPELFRLASKNIKMNKLENVCEVFNVAVGKKKQDNNLEDQTFKEMFINNLEVKEYLNGVPMITLAEIVEKFNLSDAFLKLDCEGYEYDIILNTQKEIIRKFDYIIMEYHYGFENLKNKLQEAGFLVNYTKPKRAFINNRPPRYRKMMVGYLTAKKMD